MTRDAKKYVYLTIGMPRNGYTHKALLADAAEHNTKHLPTIAGIRLSEYYRLRDKGIVPSVAPTSDALVEIDDLAVNADAANDAWPE
jgi:hypothetical protein